MNERQIDLAHTVALGSIDDEEHHKVQELLDSGDPVLRAEFIKEVQRTREVLSAVAAATSAVIPSTLLRTRILETVAAEDPPVAS